MKKGGIYIYKALKHEESDDFMISGNLVRHHKTGTIGILSVHSKNGKFVVMIGDNEITHKQFKNETKKLIKLC